MSNLVCGAHFPVFFVHPASPPSPLHRKQEKDAHESSPSSRARRRRRGLVLLFLLSPSSSHRRPRRRRPRLRPPLLLLPLRRRPRPPRLPQRAGALHPPSPPPPTRLRGRAAEDAALPRARRARPPLHPPTLPRPRPSARLFFFFLHSPRARRRLRGAVVGAPHAEEEAAAPIAFASARALTYGTDPNEWVISRRPSTREACASAGSSHARHARAPTLAPPRRGGAGRRAPPPPCRGRRSR